MFLAYTSTPNWPLGHHAYRKINGRCLRNSSTSKLGCVFLDGIGSLGSWQAKQAFHSLKRRAALGPRTWQWKAEWWIGSLSSVAVSSQFVGMDLNHFIQTSRDTAPTLQCEISWIGDKKILIPSALALPSHWTMCRECVHPRHREKCFPTSCASCIQVERHLPTQLDGYVWWGTLLSTILNGACQWTKHYLSWFDPKKQVDPTSHHI